MIQVKEKEPQSKVQEYNTQRWDIVLLGTMLLSGVYYCAQEVPTVHNYLRQNFKTQGIVEYTYDEYINIAQSCSFGLLIFYALYVGVLCDKFKPGIIIMIQTLIVVLCQFLICLSIYADNFWLLFVGRMLMFVQSSSLFISVKILINNFSLEQYKGLSLGIMLIAISFFGINLLVEPSLVERYGLMIPTSISFAVASFSFILSIFCFKIEQNIIEQEIADTKMQYNLQQIKNNSQNILYQQQSKIQDDTNAKEEIELLTQNQQGFYEEIKSLNKTYWIYCPLMFLSNLVSTIIDLTGPGMVSHHWNLDTEKAAALNSFIQFMGLLLPILGYAVDRINRDFEWIVITCILQLIGVILIGYYSPLYGYIIFGISYNLRLAIFGPFLTKIVPKQSMGKAVGLIRCLRDVIGIFAFLYISFTLEKTHSYQYSINLLLITCCVVLFLSIQLYTSKYSSQI